MTGSDRGSSATPLVTGLDRAYYWVRDMDRAVAFYAGVLGLRLARRDGDSWAEFDVPGGRFSLHGLAEDRGMAPGGATVVFLVRDLDRAKAALRARKVEVGREGEIPGRARFASFLDPDGNTVQIVEAAGGPETET